jgi:hypothetical protein
MRVWVFIAHGLLLQLVQSQHKKKLLCLETFLPPTFLSVEIIFNKVYVLNRFFKNAKGKSDMIKIYKFFNIFLLYSVEIW